MSCSTFCKHVFFSVCKPRGSSFFTVQHKNKAFQNENEHETLVTREILINFTSLLNGHVSCNGLSVEMVKQAVPSSLIRVERLVFRYAMNVAD